MPSRLTDIILAAAFVLAVSFATFPDSTADWLKQTWGMVR